MRQKLKTAYALCQSGVGIRYIALTIGVVGLMLFVSFGTPALAEENSKSRNSDVLLQEKSESAFVSELSVFSENSRVESMPVSSTIRKDDPVSSIKQQRPKCSTVYEPAPAMPVSSSAASSGDISHAVVSGYGKLEMGIVSRDMDWIRRKIETVDLKRHSDPWDDTCSSPIREIHLDTFYSMMERLQKYNWTEHRAYINPYPIKANEITIIGSDCVYTYLIFGKDEAGKPFVWSFYDYKIAWLPEQDVAYFEEIFSKAEIRER